MLALSVDDDVTDGDPDPDAEAAAAAAAAAAAGEDGDKGSVEFKSMNESSLHGTSSNFE